MRARPRRMMFQTKVCAQTTWKQSLAVPDSWFLVARRNSQHVLPHKKGIEFVGRVSKLSSDLLPLKVLAIALGMRLTPFKATPHKSSDSLAMIKHQLSCGRQIRWFAGELRCNTWSLLRSCKSRRQRWLHRISIPGNLVQFWI